MHLSAIMYEPVIWYRCIRVPDGVKMASSLSATIYEPDVSPMEPAGMKVVRCLSAAVRVFSMEPATVRVFSMEPAGMKVVMHLSAGVFLISMHP